MSQNMVQTPQSAQVVNKKTVLIIEDDDQLQQAYQKLFTSAGIDVLQAFNAEEGLQLAQQKCPTVILLDLMLAGGKNGFDVLEDLKRDRNLYQIPVVILSNLETDKKSAMTIGAVDYLIKAETSFETLIEKVMQYSEILSAQQEPILGIPNHLPGVD